MKRDLSCALSCPSLTFWSVIIDPVFLIQVPLASLLSHASA